MRVFKKSFLCLLAGAILEVNANAFPKPTARARLHDRQATAVTAVWSQSTTDYTITSWKKYSPAAQSGVQSTVYSSSSNWGWCATTIAACGLPTTCVSGTLTYPGGSTRTCETTAPLCGTELLYPSIGAFTQQTRNICISTSEADRVTRSFLIASPLSASASSSLSLPSFSLTHITPTSKPSSKHTPVGAIVGGVIGGLAVLAIAVVAVVFILVRRKHNKAAGTQAQDQTGAVDGVNAVNAGPMPNPNTYSYYDNKHQSYVSVHPSPPAPPPQYPAPDMGMQQTYYQAPPTGSASFVSQDRVSSIEPSPVMANSYEQSYLPPMPSHTPLQEAHEMPAQGHHVPPAMPTEPRT